MATSLTIQGIKVHPSVRKKDKEHPLYIGEVEKWLKFNDEQRKIYAKEARRGHKHSLAQSLIHEGYVKEIRHYLRSGDWISDFFGKDQESKTMWRTIRA